MAAGAALAALGSCAGKPPPPAAPPPAAAPRPQAPRPVLQPAPRVAWQDAALTPGDWRWSMENGRSTARFAGGLLALACDAPAREVIVMRQGAADAHAPMTVLTSAQVRPLSADPLPAYPGYVGVALPVRDGLLDAMAFSRGRFAVEVAGLETLYLPSWSEVGRVVEDCRAAP